MGKGDKCGKKRSYASSNKISTSRSGMSTMTSWPQGTLWMRQPGRIWSLAACASNTGLG
jgi:hypothetical protein